MIGVSGDGSESVKCDSKSTKKKKDSSHKVHRLGKGRKIQ